MRPLALASLLSLLTLVGCGGGGTGPSTVPTTTGQTIAVGQGTLTFQGSTKPTVSLATSAKTFSYVVTGATLSSFNYEPFSDASALPMLVVASGSMYLLQNGTMSQISSASTGYAYTGSFTPNGQILFVGLDLTTGRDQIFACYADGTGVKKLTNSANIETQSVASMSPNGQHIIAWHGTEPFLYEFNSSGGDETTLVNQGYDPAWAPDSTHICYQDYSQNGIVTAIPGNSTETLISSAGYDFAYCPTWSPDGNAIAYLVQTSANNPTYEVETAGPAKTLYGDFPVASELPLIQPTFSADSKYLAFVQSDGTTPRLIYQGSWDGQNVSQIGSLAPGSTISSISYAPFNKPRNLISASGVLSSATGFLLNQTGNGQFGSFAAVTASPASSTKITQLNPGASGAPIYELSGTSLTALAYVNGYNLARQVVALPASTPSALLTVDPNTGQFTAVAPFVKRPTQSTNSGGTTLSGDFQGIYDGKGKLIAPKGSHSLTIDTKTGALLKTS